MIFSQKTMFWIRILVLISVQTLANSLSTSLFCTHDKWDHDINRLHSVFTIGDKVYIRSGVQVSKIWVYDIPTGEVLSNPIMGTNMFPDLPIIEFVSAVLCTQCPADVSNLVVAIGREDLNSYHKYIVYRMKADGSFTKVNPGKPPLPNVNLWGLRDGEERFTLDDPFYGFFPEEMVTLQTNSSNIHGFAFFPSLQIFSLKYYTEDASQKPKRTFLYRKLIGGGAKLTNWEETQITGNPNVLNSAFYIKDRLFAIDNDPQYMPRISHEIFVADPNAVDLVFTVKNIDIDAREFFNCYGNATTVQPAVPPVVVPQPNTTTTTTSTTSTMTPLTTISTTTTTPSLITGSSIAASTIFLTTSSIISSENTSETNPSETTLDSFTSSSDSGESVPHLENTPNGTTLVTDSSTPVSDIAENDDKDRDYVLFFIILGIIIFIIVAITLAFICLGAFIRNKNKGKQYSSLNTSSSEDGTGIKRGIVLGSSASTASVRSNRYDNYNKEDTNFQSPSQASVRSFKN